MTEQTGGWLDPSNEIHSVLECLRARPELTHADVGRRWKCHTCGKVFIVINTGYQRNPYGWEELGPTGD